MGLLGRHAKKTGHCTPKLVCGQGKELVKVRPRSIGSKDKLFGLGEKIPCGVRDVYKQTRKAIDAASMTDVVSSSWYVRTNNFM